jgi:hypothetical protein
MRICGAVGSGWHARNSDRDRMRRFIRTELALPLPHGDAIAMAPVRATTDPAYDFPALWPDVRTVLRIDIATTE